MKKKYFLAAIVLTIFAAYVLKIPGVFLDPSDVLYDSVRQKGYVWGPVRCLRIELSMVLGASPDDTIMGQTTFSRAVALADLQLVKRFEPLVSRATILDSIALRCEGARNMETNHFLHRIYEERYSESAPVCK